MKVKLFQATIATVTERFLLMMLIAGLALTTGIIPLIFIALPIFLTAILAVKFEINTPKHTNIKNITIHKKGKIINKAA